MFIHIGENTVVIDAEIIGIFDMENTTVMKNTVDFLNREEKEKNIINVSPFELPKSFVICATPKGKKVFISPVAVNTILRRINMGKDTYQSKY